MIAEIEPRIKELADYGIDAGKAEITVKQVDEDSWATAWKQYFKPLRVSETLTIKPSWEEYTPESAAEKLIEIDPGMAFGTGTHPTTSLCLRTLEKYVQGGEEVIDVGTGSGILAIGAMKFGAKHVLALDLDPVAVTSARENSTLNGLSDHITVYESDLLSILDKQDGSLVLQCLFISLSPISWQRLSFSSLMMFTKRFSRAACILLQASGRTKRKLF